MAGAWASWAESKALESATMLASAHGEADEIAQKVTLLGDELAVACQAWSMAEAKHASLVDKVANADRQRE
jgi:hypothetical protein